ncbi:MAG: caspase family protein, partial [Thiomargarita sp.]|nr:caspase family protein [Thiomargarita sp.]
MKNILFLLFPILSACIADPPIKTSEPPGGEEARGAEPVLVLDPQNNTVLSYINSYALIIGQSNYINGWSSLSTVPGEVEKVAVVLREQGFVVEKHLNLNAVDLEKSYKDFIKNYGYDSKNRLLFFFSGHGHSRFEGKKGYIVPIDAPNPNVKGQEQAFVKTAISMTQINAWAKEIEAQHALFLFDSCFSGTVFQNKAGTNAPPYITEAISNPARQFITAGNADEMVPSESVFTPAFVNALRYKLGDLNGDGYVTGVELGFYLANEVPKHASQQHPQYGKIQGYDFSLGDFVFVLDQKKRIPPSVVKKVVSTPVIVPVIKEDSNEIKRLKWQIAQAKQETQDLLDEKNKEIALKKQVEEDKRKKAKEVRLQQEREDKENARLAKIAAQQKAEKERQEKEIARLKRESEEVERRRVVAQEKAESARLARIEAEKTPLPVSVGEVFRDRLKDGTKGPQM